MTHTLQLPTETPIEEMGKIHNFIAQEAISMSGITRALKDFMPGMRDSFSRYARGFSQHEPSIELKGDDRTFARMILAQQYLNIAPIAAYVPQGLNVHYVDYLDILLEGVKHVQDNTMRVMNDYSVFLAQIITNREMKFSVESHEAQYKKMEVERKALISRMSDCFLKGSVRTDVTYGDVVERNGDWPEVINKSNIAMKSINLINRTALHKKADECDKYLQTIIKMISDGKFEGAGPEVTTNLSNGAYQAACELEFFTVIFFKLTVLATAISDTMKATTETLKKK